MVYNFWWDGGWMGFGQDLIFGCFGLMKTITINGYMKYMTILLLFKFLF